MKPTGAVFHSRLVSKVGGASRRRTTEQVTRAGGSQVLWWLRGDEMFPSSSHPPLIRTHTHTHSTHVVSPPIGVCVYVCQIPMFSPLNWFTETRRPPDVVSPTAPLHPPMAPGGGTLVLVLVVAFAAGGEQEEGLRSCVHLSTCIGSHFSLLTASAQPAEVTEVAEVKATAHRLVGEVEKKLHPQLDSRTSKLLLSIFSILRSISEDPGKDFFH